MGYQEDVAAARAKLDEASKAYAAAVRDAEKVEKQARKAYEKGVKDAEKALDNYVALSKKAKASFGGMQLFADRVDSSMGSIALVGSVDARVDVSAAGPVAGRKKKGGAKDDRPLFVTVTSDDGQLVEEGDASQEKEAREFVAKVINQSKVAQDGRTQQADEIERLSQTVEDAKADSEELDAAVAALQAAKDATQERDEAERLLEETLASGSEEERAALQEKELKAKRMKMGVIGAAACVALLVLLFATHVICFHNWQDATCTEPQICSICGRTKGEPLGHEWQAATCTEPKTCERCGETEGEALGHEVKKWETVKEATCTEEGSEKGTCTRCGEEQTRAVEKKEHDFGKWTTTKEATCTEEGESTRTCKNCKKKETKVIAKKDHTPGDWEVIEAPSVTSSGVVKEGTRARSCTVCGQQLETESFTLELTMGQRNALAKAASYLSWSAFSYSGLVEQLEFEGYSHEDATFAADNCGADWNEQAAKKAESYLSWTSFSREGLIEQLEFEGFTREQAEYGAQSVGY